MIFMREMLLNFQHSKPDLSTKDMVTCLDGVAGMADSGWQDAIIHIDLISRELNKKRTFMQSNKIISSVDNKVRKQL